MIYEIAVRKIFDMSSSSGLTADLISGKFYIPPFMLISTRKFNPLIDKSKDSTKKAKCIWHAKNVRKWLIIIPTKLFPNEYSTFHNKFKNLALSNLKRSV